MAKHTMYSGAAERQIDKIRLRYADPTLNVVPSLAEGIVAEKVRRVLSNDEIRGARILEIGAGCSPHISYFLDLGCAAYVANDLVPERLAANRVHDPRYSEACGDILKTSLPEGGFDVVFTNLTLMFLVPMLDEVFARITGLLKPGGVFATSGEPNYLNPLAFIRMFTAKGVNPSDPFAPWTLKNKAEAAGLEVERLIPYTSGLPWTVGNWAAATSLALRARKPD